MRELFVRNGKGIENAHCGRINTGRRRIFLFYLVRTSAPVSVISTMYSICADNPSSMV